MSRSSPLNDCHHFVFCLACLSVYLIYTVKYKYKDIGFVCNNYSFKKKKISSKIIKVCTNEGNFYFSNNACDATNAVVIDETCVSNKSI